MAQYIDFVLAEEGKKTNIWDVVTAEKCEELGVIKWFSRWRKYSFFPLGGTVYENICLKDIAEFIEEQMRERRQRK